MSIEKEIKQEKFANSHQKAVVNIIYTGNWLRDRDLKVLKPYDLLPQHFNVLRILKGKHPQSCSPGEIKEVILDKGADVTRLVDKLEKMELVTRFLCPGNRRKMEILLTGRGITLLEEITNQMKKQGRVFQENLTEAEAEALSRLLDKLRG